MNKLMILFVIFLFFISVGIVSAEGNFTALQGEIESSIDHIEITQDYTYDNTTDYKLNNGILINKTEFTINGNGHTIDGSNQARIFKIFGNNTIINNFNFINAYVPNDFGGAIFAQSSIILNNVTFINNYAQSGGAIYNQPIVNIIYYNDSTIVNRIVFNNTLNNVLFSNNHAENHGGSICVHLLNVSNCIFNNNTAKFGGSIYSKENSYIADSIFANSTSSYAPAIFVELSLKICNSIFQNLSALQTAGAIGIKNEFNTEIINCSFFNTKARKNGGSIYIDSMPNGNPETTYILNSSFINASGDYGGAIVKLEKNLTIENSRFINNTALYAGGAIYTSLADLFIKNTTITDNKIFFDKNGTGGGLYLDYSNTTIENSYITDNTGQGIYAFGKKLEVKNTLFSNNGEAIHGVFLNHDLKNITLGNDTLCLNNTSYENIVHDVTKPITLINNTIDVETLPSRYDSRDWGWVTPVKNQGDRGSCWTFGTVGALESALLKATGIEYDFSENNILNNQLRYSKYGSLHPLAIDGGDPPWAMEYILSWFGPIPEEYDTYDELSKISPLFKNIEKVHVFDAIVLESRKNSTDNDELKKAILKCGSVATSFSALSYSFNNETSSFYQNFSCIADHSICIVGWDDNYPASKFLLTPPGNGAFIIKNSWGDSWGDNGYCYLSYYDISLLNGSQAIGFIIDNAEEYTTNYQTDLSGTPNTIKNPGNKQYYKNTYVGMNTELISAVGTYFEKNENYTIEIYVNDEIMHTQSGIAPFSGYHTIKLTSEIPIKKGDKFTALVEKDSMMIFNESRQYYMKGVSFTSTDKITWSDCVDKNETISLKIYTKDLPVYTEDLVKYYKNASKFEANVGVANETVVFEIMGIKYPRISDENGTASLAINLRPGNYTIKTTYKNFTVENNVHVISTLIAQNLVKYFQNASQFYIELVDGQGNPVPNTNVTMNIHGILYTRTTNENGTARLNINLAPGDYILTAADPFTGLEMSYNITVLPTLIASDLEMKYKDGSTFNVTVLDGQGNPLANVAVTFNINGVFYTRYTNSEGIAKLNINLMAGKYIITSMYDGLAIANTITIKD